MKTIEVNLYVRSVGSYVRAVIEIPYNLVKNARIYCNGNIVNYSENNRRWEI